MSSATMVAIAEVHLRDKLYQPLSAVTPANLNIPVVKNAPLSSTTSSALPSNSEIEKTNSKRALESNHGADSVSEQLLINMQTIAGVILEMNNSKSQIIILRWHSIVHLES